VLASISWATPCATFSTRACEESVSELLEVHDLTVHFATEDGLVEPSTT